MIKQVRYAAKICAKIYLNHASAMLIYLLLTITYLIAFPWGKPRKITEVIVTAGLK